jgi:hypothetical protein
MYEQRLPSGALPTIMKMRTWKKTTTGRDFLRSGVRLRPHKSHACSSTPSSAITCTSWVTEAHQAHEAPAQQRLSSTWWCNQHPPTSYSSANSLGYFHMPDGSPGILGTYSCKPANPSQSEGWSLGTDTTTGMTDRLRSRSENATHQLFLKEVQQRQAQASHAANLRSAPGTVLLSH